MTLRLTEEEIDMIAEKAADKAVAKMTNMVYQGVGKSVVNKLFYIVGATVVGLYVWLKFNGYIK